MTLATYTRYRRYYDAQQASPGTVLNGADFDADYDRIKTFSDAVSAALALIQRDDGALKNASVGIDQLKTEIISLLNGVRPRGAWVTATAYAVNDFVSSAGNSYFCLIAHTSGNFASDLAAAKWMALSSLTTAASVAFTPAGGIVATNVQAAIAELDGEKQPLDATLTALSGLTVAANKLIYATGTDALATADLTAAGRALLDDASAAAQLTTLGALPKAGGTMTGALTLSGAPTNALHATTRAYVDSVAGGGTVAVPAGSLFPFSGFVLPAGFLWPNGAAHSRATYADLYAATNKTGTVTMTLATPGVVSWASHGLQENWPIKFTTTGALPTGLVAGTTYYLKSVSGGTFRLAATPGGSDIATSVSQSGVHTAIFSPFGDGDGSTTFNVIDLRGRTAFGLDDLFTTASSRVTSASSINGKTIGAVGGAEIHTLTSSQQASMPISGAIAGPVYTNVEGGVDLSFGLTGDGANIDPASEMSGTATGGGLPHNNMPPAIMVPWIVKT